MGSKATTSLRMLASISLLLLVFDAFRIDRRKKNRGEVRNGFAMQTSDPDLDKWLTKNGYTNAALSKETKLAPWKGKTQSKFPLFTAIKRKNQKIVTKLVTQYFVDDTWNKMRNDKYTDLNLWGYAKQCKFTKLDDAIRSGVAQGKKIKNELGAAVDSKASEEGHADFSFALLADPQLGFFHAYDDKPTNLDKMDEELAVLDKIVHHLATQEFVPKLEFVGVLGDMQQYYPTGFNNKLLPQDTGAKQRAAVKKALEPLKAPVKYLPGNHDIDDEVTKPVLDEYERAWGEDYYSFEAHGINFIVLNSQLYYDDNDLEDHKAAQTSFFWEQVIAKENNVVLTHIPPFIKTMNDEHGWGNWKDRQLFRDHAKHPYFPKQWFCGHLHKNAVNTVNGIEIVVSSSCATTMDWDGITGDFTPEQALETMKIVPKNLGAAVGQLFDKNGKKEPGEDRSGVRLVTCNALNKPLCRHEWVTVKQLEGMANLTQIK